MTVGAGGSSAWSDDLHGALAKMLAQHHRIVAAEEDLAAARLRARAALGARLPTLGVTSHYGFESINNPDTDDTHLPSRELDLELTQLLWDFGSSSAAIKTARLTFDQAQENLSATRQTLLLEGISALLDVYRTQRKLDYARQSVTNIKHQTELEDARVKEGSGYSTDVLQAKSQLAGAQSQRVKAEEEFRMSLNRHKTVFGKYPDTTEAMSLLTIPTHMLPNSEDDAVEIAQKENPQLILLSIGVQVAEEAVNETRGDELFPSVNIVAGSKKKQDVAGVPGFKSENMVKLELSYDFNFGLSSYDRVEATRHDREATTSRLKETRDQIEEQVRNSWMGLLTAKENSDFLQNKTAIAEEFLKLAREERSLGRRSLMDVLAGETALINSLSEAVAAETNIVMKSYELLEKIGRLELTGLQLADAMIKRKLSD